MGKSLQILPKVFGIPLHAMTMTSPKTFGHPEMYFLLAFKIPYILRYISNYIAN
jgi:hypothetical protein